MKNRNEMTISELQTEDIKRWKAGERGFYFTDERKYRPIIIEEVTEYTIFCRPVKLREGCTAEGYIVQANQVYYRLYKTEDIIDF